MEPQGNFSNVVKMYSRIGKDATCASIFSRESKIAPMLLDDGDGLTIASPIVMTVSDGRSVSRCLEKLCFPFVKF